MQRPPLPPLQGGPDLASIPGVKTPGLVLSSLRDKFGIASGTPSLRIRRDPHNRLIFALGRNLDVRIFAGARDQKSLGVVAGRRDDMKPLFFQALLIEVGDIAN